MACVILLVCFMSMLAISTQAMPSQAPKTANAERIFREEFRPEVLGSHEMAESRKAKIRARVVDRSLGNLKPRNVQMLVNTVEIILKCHH